MIFNFENVGIKVNNIGQTPLDICYKQEIERMQTGFTTLCGTLDDLELAIGGTNVLNDLLCKSMNHVYDGFISFHWLRIS
jgi:hypothetical protein